MVPAGGALEDAAVFRPEGAARSLLFTVDVITPIVDDPRVFGAIAAANSMSDVYAMGGRPETALCFAGFPTDKLPLEMLHEVLAGVQEMAGRAGCAVLGGHTIVDPEPKCGLSVIGSVEPERIWLQDKARPGDVLVLTKALGTGIVGQAIRAGTADPALVARATAQMLGLNDVARDVGLSVFASSCTDVTGFGLLGHLRNIVEAAGLSATVWSSKVPLIEGVRELAAAGKVPGGSKRNLGYVAPICDFAPELDETARLLLTDAQTSGGLLLCVPEATAELAVRGLREGGCEHAEAIGVLESGEPRIHVR